MKTTLTVLLLHVLFIFFLSLNTTFKERKEKKKVEVAFIIDESKPQQEPIKEALKPVIEPIKEVLEPVIEPVMEVEETPPPQPIVEEIVEEPKESPPIIEVKEVKKEKKATPKPKKTVPKKTAPNKAVKAKEKPKTKTKVKPKAKKTTTTKKKSTAPTKKKPTAETEKLTDLLKKSLSQLESGGKKGSTAIAPTSYKKIESLGSETLADVAIKKLSYEDEIASILKRRLKLVDSGDVKIKLTLNALGKVATLSIISATSDKNRELIEKKVPTLTFPPFDSRLEGETSHTFTVKLKSD